MRLTVTRRERAAAGVVALTLTDPAGGPLPPWTPGAHVDLLLAPGLVRQYSLCSDPADLGHYRIAVLLAEGGGGGSAYVHDALSPGASVEVSAPRNHFELTGPGPHVLVAGGIGVTPLLPMARALAARGEPWRMLYAGRSPESMAFTRELRSLAGDALTIVTGLPDLRAYLAEQPAATVHACGPAPMLDAVRTLHPGPVHTERFTPSAARPTAAAFAASGDDGDAFEVELVRSGCTVRVAGGRSVLDALREAGLDPAASCEAGICGTCETKVLAGTPDHRDDLLTPEERAGGQTMMVCVSRSLGPRLTLDL